MKNKRIVLFLMFVVLSCTTLFAAPYTLGNLEAGSLTLVYDGYTIDTYKVYDTNYIVAVDLRQLGCSVSYSSAEQRVTISAPLRYNSVETTTGSLVGQPFTLGTSTIDFDGLHVQGLTSNGTTLIPISTLRQFGDLIIEDNLCTFVPKAAPVVKANADIIVNTSASTATVTLVDIYWNDQELSTTSVYTLEPYESLLREPILHDAENPMYISTIVQIIEGTDINYKNRSYLGQLNTPLLQYYSRLVNRSAVEEYGDLTSMDELMRVENYVNGKGLSSSTEYLIWTHIDSQRTYIFEGSQYNWTLVKCFICSTGRDSTPTPRGTFKLDRKSVV